MYLPDICLDLQLKQTSLHAFQQVRLMALK